MDTSSEIIKERKTFGDVLKIIRLDIFGLSLLDFGELIGLSASSYQRFENNSLGKNFERNKIFKLRDISESISNAAFNESLIIRKSKIIAINTDIHRMCFNKKVKEKLLPIYLNCNFYDESKYELLKNFNVDVRKSFEDFLYTFFIYYLNIENEPNYNEKSDSKCIEVNREELERESKLNNLLGQMGDQKELIGHPRSFYQQFDMFFNLTVNDEADFIPFNELIQYIRTQNGHYIITGEPGIGKSTLALTLAQQLNGSRLIKLNQYGKYADLAKDIDDQTSKLKFLIIDGLEDLVTNETGTCRSLKTILDFVLLILRSGNAIKIFTVQDSYYENIFQADTLGLISVRIHTWTQTQLKSWCEQKNLTFSNGILSDFMKIPFYFNLYNKLTERYLSFSSEYLIIDYFLKMNLADIEISTGVSRFVLYDFLIEVAFLMRQNGTSILDDLVVLRLWKKHSGETNSLCYVTLLVESEFGYTFRHNLFLEFLIAKQLICNFVEKQQVLNYDRFQTSYMEDIFIATQIKQEKETIALLETTVSKTDDEILKVNILGLLSKISNYDWSFIWKEVQADSRVLKRYKDAIMFRLFHNDINIDREVRIRKLQSEISYGRDNIAKEICTQEMKILISGQEVVKNNEASDN